LELFAWVGPFSVSQIARITGASHGVQQEGKHFKVGLLLDILFKCKQFIFDKLFFRIVSYTIFTFKQWANAKTSTNLS
jgi:hypothetical protein